MMVGGDLEQLGWIVEPMNFVEHNTATRMRIQKRLWITQRSAYLQSRPNF